MPVISINVNSNLRQGKGINTLRRHCLDVCLLLCSEGVLIALSLLDLAVNYQPFEV